MTTAELITLLQTQPQHLQVAYRLYSEACLLEIADLTIVTACQPRPDGWIQEERKDKQLQTYLMFSGG